MQKDTMRKPRILKTFIFLLLSFILCSCSPQKRLDRLIKKYPELLTKDTVTEFVEVIIPAKNAEFQINYLYRDTLITTYAIDTISRDTIKLSYIVTNDSIIEVLIHVPPDTVTELVEVLVDRIKYITPDNYGLFLEKVPYICMAVVALLIAGFFIRRK
jgi:hypothetical protein